MSKELQVQAEGHIKKFKISKIENGIVIDHIPAGMAIKVEEVLNLPAGNEVMIGKNFSSVKTGKKDILKVENCPRDRITKEIQDKIAVICREAKYPTTIWFIENGKKKDKILLQMPDIIINIIRCINPKCIVTLESHTVTRKKFYVLKKDPLIVKCHYCERKMNEKDIILI